MGCPYAWSKARVPVRTACGGSAKERNTSSPSMMALARADSGTSLRNSEPAPVDSNVSRPCWLKSPTEASARSRRSSASGSAPHRAARFSAVSGPSASRSAMPSFPTV